MSVKTEIEKLAAEFKAALSNLILTLKHDSHALEVEAHKLVDDHTEKITAVAAAATETTETTDQPAEGQTVVAGATEAETASGDTPAAETGPSA